MAKVGRPSDYKPEYVEKVLEWSKNNGSTRTQLARNLGTSRTTLYQWAKENPEFAAALETGREWAQAYQEDILNAAIFGKIPKYNATAHALLLNNQFGFSRNPNDSSNINNTQININNMNILQDKSTAELLEHIKQAASQLSDVIDVSDYEVLKLDSPEESDKE